MNEISTQRLRNHAYELAGTIGEHNIFHPDALHTAEAYITDEWRQQGYDVRKQRYTVQGVECANLEITCTGSRSGNDVILIGAHYDPVLGNQGANDIASEVQHYWNFLVCSMKRPPATGLHLLHFFWRIIPIGKCSVHGFIGIWK